MCSAFHIFPSRSALHLYLNPSRTPAATVHVHPNHRQLIYSAFHIFQLYLVLILGQLYTATVHNFMCTKVVQLMYSAYYIFHSYLVLDLGQLYKCI